MGFRKNIIISFVFHVIIITALFSLNYRKRVFPLPKGYVEVSLLEELSENKFYAITRNYYNRLHHPEHSEVSRKQYSLLTVRSVTGEETLRLHLGMAGYNGIASGEEIKMKEKSKSEIVLFREEVPKMLRKASPFPELSGDIVIPVIFRLKESISDR
jgi:hypothetical protein